MSRLSRRAMMIRSGAFALLAPIPVAAVGSTPRERGPLDNPIRDALQQLLPGEAQQALRLVEEVIALEADAGRRGLPDTLLSVGMLARSLPDADRLYLRTMPRLVALVDRGEIAKDLPFADRAGKLLADLHHGQRTRSEGLLSTRLVGGRRYASVGTASQEVSTATAFPALRDEYARMFHAVQLRPQYADEARWHLNLLRHARPRYEAVARRTEVPWYVIGVIHGLEASFNFRGHLHNGDFPLHARTKNVPAGRPRVWLPPVEWEESAVDALRHTGFVGQDDWSLPRTLHRIEAYNGFGYRKRGVPTPYLWSFGDHYDRGKFVSDGRWDPRARSEQCGAAMMLRLLRDAGDIQL